MAVVSSKPSSPNISARPNPVSRNSEVGNSMRRSFAGNPFAGNNNKPSVVPNPRGLMNPNTPANSPAENLRRNPNDEDKENLRAAKLRSPMGPKGTKNFMSPTISAASKITASPRKRILEEQNEAVRGSVSMFSEPKREEGAESEGEDLTELSDSLPETSSVSEEVVDDLANLGPNFKISPPSAPVIAPLDSDPKATVAPPYDPKTNYLSPRPRFLHYKPNPRVELYLSNVRDGQKRLEDSFASGVSSDNEEEQEELESDVSSAEEMKPEEDEEEEEEELVVSDHPSPNEERPSAETVENPRSVCRWKNLVAFLIVLSIIGVSILVMTSSPVVDHSFFDESPSNIFAEFDHTEVLEFAKGNLHGLARKLSDWYENTASFVYDLLTPNRMEYYLDYLNMTEEVGDVYGRDVTMFLPETKIQVLDFSTEFYNEKALEKVLDELLEEVLKAEGVEPGNGVSVGESAVSETDEAEPEESDNVISLILQPDEVAESEISSVESELAKGEVEATEPEASLSKEDEKVSEVDVKAAEETADEISVLPVKGEEVTADFRVEETRNDMSGLTVIGTAVFVVFIAIASVAIAMKDKLSSFGDAEECHVGRQELVNKKNTVEVKHSSLELSGDYCPSEMSSYENDNNKGHGTNGGLSEAQSNKKNHRRESMDSSMGSPSYGSFTTYEKLPAKHSYRGDEEIVTPVRRSSRLRSQVVTSPA